MAMIPSVIHLVFLNKEEPFPPLFKTCQERIWSFHPHWDIRLYHEEESLAILSDHLPSLLQVYRSYKHTVQKADLLRVVLVYLFGGFYLDLDMFCLKALDPLTSFSLVLGEEKTITEGERAGKGLRHRLRIANYMFGSIPGHPFWLHFIKEMLTVAKLTVNEENDILETTGPGLLTDVFHSIGYRFADLTLLRNYDRTCLRPGHKVVSCHFGNYAAHLHEGSWRWGGVAAGVGEARGLAPAGGTETGERMAPAAGRAETGEGAALAMGRSDVREGTATADRGAVSAAGMGWEEAVACIDDRLDRGPGFGGAPFLLGAFASGSDSYGCVRRLYDQLARHCEGLGLGEKVTANRPVLVMGDPLSIRGRLAGNPVSTWYSSGEGGCLPGEGDFLSVEEIEFINTTYRSCLVPHQGEKDRLLTAGIQVPVRVIHPGFTRFKRDFGAEEGQRDFTIGFLETDMAGEIRVACERLRGGPIPALQVVSVPPGQEDQSDWYRSLHCYLSVDAAGGWSTGPLESLYMGIPTIIRAGGPYAEGALSGFYHVMGGEREGTEQGIADGDVGDRGVGANGDAIRGIVVRDVTAIEIADSILEVYSRYPYYNEKALEGATWIEDRWTAEWASHEVLSHFSLPLPL